MKVSTLGLMVAAPALAAAYLVTNEVQFLLQSAVTAALALLSAMIWFHATTQRQRFVILTLLSTARSLGLPGMLGKELVFRAPEELRPGSVYVVLSGLEQDGLILGSSEIAPEYVGINRIRFAITDAGHDHWSELIASLKWWSK